MENNLKIDKLISISGFNNYLVGDIDYDSVNSSMFVKNLSTFKKLANEIICVISENDPYVKLKALIDFSNVLGATLINIKNGGHFNTDSGYGCKFEEILKLV